MSTDNHFAQVHGVVFYGTVAMVGTLAAILGVADWLEPTWSHSGNLIGYAICGLFVIAAVAAYLTAFAAVLRRVRSRTSFNRPSLCKSCGYNLTGNVSGICPECGTAVEHSRA